MMTTINKDIIPDSYDSEISRKPMDVDEIWDYFQQQNLSSTEFNLLDQRMEEMTPSPTFPPLCQNDLETILSSLFPNEENISDYINDGTELTVDNNGFVMDSGYDSLRKINETSQECANQISCNDISQDCQSNNSVLDTLEQLITSTFKSNDSTSSSSFSSDIRNDALIEAGITPYSTQNSSQSLIESSNEFNKLFLKIPRLYSDPQSNISTPIDQGFKPTLSLCTDTSLVEEPWKPNVAKKILSAFYTPLNLRSEFLAAQTALDEFQSLALKEAVAAFYDVALVNSILYQIGQNNADSCPKILVGACKKIRAYRRLQMEDKVTLLSNVFFDVVAMKSVLTYDHLTDSWNCAGVRVKRQNVFRYHSSLHDGIVHVIETFPDRWRRDITVATLVYLILIFNPDLPNLKFQESIRLEHYTYIYLLKRYLESTCEYSDASDYHYRLMAKIEEIQNLRQQVQNAFEMCIVNYSLSSCIASLVKCNDLT